MHTLKLKHPVIISFQIREINKKETPGNFIKNLLNHYLRASIEGVDKGITYNCTSNPSLRLLQIQATREAVWNGSWNTDVQVISADTWQPNEDMIQLVYQYLWRSNDGGHESDAENAAEAIRERIKTGLNALANDPEYKDKIKIIG